LTTVKHSSGIGVTVGTTDGTGKTTLDGTLVGKLPAGIMTIVVLGMVMTGTLLGT